MESSRLFVVSFLSVFQLYSISGWDLPCPIRLAFWELLWAHFSSLLARFSVLRQRTESPWKIGMLSVFSCGIVVCWCQNHMAVLSHWGYGVLCNLFWYVFRSSSVVLHLYLFQETESGVNLEDLFSPYAWEAFKTLNLSEELVHSRKPTFTGHFVYQIRRLRPICVAYTSAELCLTKPRAINFVYPSLED